MARLAVLLSVLYLQASLVLPASLTRHVRSAHGDHDHGDESGGNHDDQGGRTVPPHEPYGSREGDGGMVLPPHGPYSSEMGSGHGEQDLASFLARHIISPREGDDAQVRDLARAVIMSRDLHESHTPGGDVLSLLLRSVHHDGSMEQRGVDERMVQEVMQKLGLINAHQDLIDVINNALDSDVTHPGASLVERLQAALDDQGRTDVLRAILHVLEENQSEHREDWDEMNEQDEQERERIREALDERMGEMGGDRMGNNTGDDDYIRLILAADMPTRQALVRLVLSQTSMPSDLVKMILEYMMHHPDEMSQTAGAEVLGIIMTQLYERGTSEQQLQELFYIIISAAISDHMPYSGRGAILALVVESTLASEEYNELNAIRHLVENSFAQINQESVIQMVDNLTVSALLVMFQDNKPQQDIATFLISNLPYTRTAETFRLQMEFLLYTNLGFYLDAADDVIMVGLGLIINDVMPTLDVAELSELLRLMVTHAVSEKVGEMPHAAFLQMFLTQQTSGALDQNSTREALRFLTFNYLDQIIDGASSNEVIQYLVNRGIEIELSSQGATGDGFFSGLVYLALQPEIETLDGEDVMAQIMGYVINNTNEAEILQQVVHHLLVTRASNSFENAALVRLLVEHVGEVEHSREERDVIIQALVVQAMREHFGAPGAQVEILEALVQNALSDDMARQHMIMFLMRHAALGQMGHSNRDGVHELLEMLVHMAVSNEEHHDMLLSMLLHHIVEGGHGDSQRELLRMLLEVALPHAREIIARLDMSSDEAGNMLRELLEHALDSQMGGGSHEMSREQGIDRDTLGLIVLHLITDGGFDDEDSDVVHQLTALLMTSRGDWEFEFLKNAVLHALLHDLSHNDHHDDMNMWMWNPPRPCRIRDRAGNVLHSEECQGSAMCLLEMPETVVNDTFMYPTFCAYSAQFYLYHACEVNVNGEPFAEDRIGSCAEDDQCAAGPIRVTLNQTEAEVTLCMSVLEYFGGPLSVLNASCRVEDEQAMTIQQTRCPTGYSCTDGPFPASMRGRQDNVRAFMCQSDDMSSDSVVRQLLEELQGRHGNSDDREDRPGRDEDHTTPAMPTLPPGVLYTDADVVFLKYIVLNTLIMERSMAESGEHMGEMGHSRVEMVRAILEQAVSDRDRGHHDGYGHDNMQVRRTLVDALTGAGDNMEAMLRSLLQTARDQRTKEMSEHMFYFILDGIMALPTQHMREEALHTVIDFIDAIPDDEELMAAYTFMVEFLLSEQAGKPEHRAQAIEFVTRDLVMIQDDATRHMVLEFLAHIIMEHGDYMERQLGLRSMLRVLNAHREDRHENRAHALMVALLEQEGEKRTNLINGIMQQALDQNELQGGETFETLLKAIVSIGDRDVRNRALDDVLRFMVNLTDEQTDVALRYMMGFILEQEAVVVPTLQHIVQFAITYFNGSELGDAAAYLNDVISSHPDEQQRALGLYVVNEVLAGRDLAGEMEEIARGIMEGGEARERAIRRTLMAVIEMRETNEQLAMADMQSIFAMILSLKTQHAKLEAMQTLLMVGNSASENQEQAEDLFKFMIQSLVSMPEHERNEGLRLMIHAIQMHNDHDEMNAAKALMIQVISAHPNEEERQHALRVVFSAVSGGSNVEDERRVLQAALQAGDAERSRVIREVLSHAYAMYHTNNEESGRIFRMLLEELVNHESTSVRYSGIQVILQFIDNIDSDEDKSEVFGYMIGLLLTDMNSGKEEALRNIIQIASHVEDDHEREEFQAGILAIISRHENVREREAGLRIVSAAIASRHRESGGGDRHDMGGNNNRELMDALAQGGEMRRNAIQRAMERSGEVGRHDPMEGARIFREMIQTVMSQQSARDREAALYIVMEFLDMIQDEHDRADAFTFFVQVVLELSENQRDEGLRTIVRAFMAHENREEREAGLAFLIQVVSNHMSEHEREAGLRVIFAALNEGGHGGDMGDNDLREALARGGEARRNAIQRAMERSGEASDSMERARIFREMIQTIMSQQSARDREAALYIVMEFFDMIQDEHDRADAFTFFVQVVLESSENQRDEGLRTIVRAFMAHENREEREAGLAFLIQVVSNHMNEHEREAGLRVIFAALNGGDHGGDMGDNDLREALARGGEARRNAIQRAMERSGEASDSIEGARIFREMIQTIMSQQSARDREAALYIVMEFLDMIQDEHDRAEAFSFFVQVVMELSENQRDEGLRTIVRAFMAHENREEREAGLAFLIQVVSNHMNEHEREAGLRVIFAALNGGDHGGDMGDNDLREALARGGEARRNAIQRAMERAGEASDMEGGRIFREMIQTIMSQQSARDREAALYIVMEFLDMIQDEHERAEVFTFFVQVVLELSENQRDEGLQTIVRAFMAHENRDEREAGLAFLIQVVSNHENEREREAGLRVIFAALNEGGHGGDMGDNDLREALARGGDARRNAIQRAMERAGEASDMEGGRIFREMIQTLMSQHSARDREAALYIVMEFLDMIHDEHERAEVFTFFVQVVLELSENQRDEGLRTIVRAFMAHENREEREAGLAFLIQVVSNHENEREREAGLRVIFAALNEGGHSGDMGDNDLREALARGGDARRNAIQRAMERSGEVGRHDPMGGARIFREMIQTIMSQQSARDREAALYIVMEFLDHIQDEHERAEAFTFFVQVVLELTENQRDEGLRTIVRAFMAHENREEREAGLAFLIRVVSNHENERQREAGLRVIFAALQDTDRNNHDDDDNDRMGPNTELIDAMRRLLRQGDMTEIGEAIRGLLRYAFQQRDEESRDHIVEFVVRNIMDQINADARKMALNVVLEVLHEVQDEDLQMELFISLVHFIMEQSSETLVSEGFELIFSRIMAFDSEEEQIGGISAVIEAVARHPNEDLRRMVLFRILSQIVSLANEGNMREDSVDHDMVSDLLDIIHGNRHEEHGGMRALTRGIMNTGRL